MGQLAQRPLTATGKKYEDLGNDERFSLLKRLQYANSLFRNQQKRYLTSRSRGTLQTRYPLYGLW
jgi:hypothetical protein